MTIEEGQYNTWEEAINAAILDDRELTLQGEDFTDMGELAFPELSNFKFFGNGAKVSQFVAVRWNSITIVGMNIVEAFTSKIHRSERIMVDKCKFESIQGVFLRIETSSSVTVNRSEFVQTWHGMKDAAAVLVRGESDSYGIDISGNHFENVTDGVQFGWSDRYVGYMPGARITGNTCLVTSDFYVPNNYAKTENFVDLKIGGIPGMPVIIEDNLISGLRPTDSETSGSAGSSFVFQQKCTDVEVCGNIVQDCTAGMLIFRDVERVLIESNYFKDFVSHNHHHSFAVMDASKNTTNEIRNNAFRKVPDIAPDGAIPVGSFIM